MPLFLHIVVQVQWKRGKRKMQKKTKKEIITMTKTTSDLEELLIMKEFTA